MRRHEVVTRWISASSTLDVLVVGHHEVGDLLHSAAPSRTSSKMISPAVEIIIRDVGLTRQEIAQRLRVEACIPKQRLPRRVPRQLQRGVEGGDGRRMLTRRRHGNWQCVRGLSVGRNEDTRANYNTQRNEISTRWRLNSNRKDEPQSALPKKGCPRKTASKPAHIRGVLPGRTCPTW